MYNYKYLYQYIEYSLLLSLWDLTQLSYAIVDFNSYYDGPSLLNGKT